MEIFKNISAHKYKLGDGMEEEYSKYINMVEELQENLAKQIFLFRNNPDKKNAQKIILKHMKQITKETKKMREEIKDSWSLIKKEWKKSKNDLGAFAEMLQREKEKIKAEAEEREKLAKDAIQIIKTKANKDRYPPITPDELANYIFSYGICLTDEAKSIAENYVKKIESESATIGERSVKEQFEKIIELMNEALENNDGKKLLTAFYIFSQYYQSDETKNMYQNIYNALEIKLDDVAKYFAKEYAKQLEEGAKTAHEENKKGMLADRAWKIKKVAEEDDAKKLLALLNPPPCPSSCPVIQPAGKQPTTPQQTSRQPSSPGGTPSDQGGIQSPPTPVLEYAALLRAREKIFQGSYHVRSVLQREQQIIQNYIQYLRAQLAAGADDNERAAILRREMEILNQAAYQNTVRDRFNRWWRRHAGLRMFIGLGMLGAGIAAMFINPLLGAGILIARGVWNGIGAWMTTEGMYDGANHVWRRSREDGARRVIRNILTGRELRESDLVDAVHMGTDTADRIAIEGVGVARNIRGHRIVKRILSITVGGLVAAFTGVVQGIMGIWNSIVSPHDAGATFASHVKEAGAGSMDKVMHVSGDSTYVYTAEHGGSIWNGSEQAVDHYARMYGISLTPQERLYAVDALKDHVCANLPGHDVYQTVPTTSPTGPGIYPGQTVVYPEAEVLGAIGRAKGYFASGGQLYNYGVGGDGELVGGWPGKTGMGKWLFDTVEQKWEFVPIKKVR
ncbi:MAG: hypothetical protein QXX46_03990 [Candidatus Anstonellales archaeon]